MKDKTIHEDVRSKFHKERLVVLALAGAVAFNYPLLQIFDSGKLLFGIPLFYLYLFGTWAVVILTAAWVLEHKVDDDQQAEEFMPDDHLKS